MPSAVRASSSIDAFSVAQQLVDALAAARRMGYAPVVGLLTADQVSDLNDAASAAKTILEGRTDEAAEVIHEFQPLTTDEPTAATTAAALSSADGGTGGLANIPEDGEEGEEGVASQAGADVFVCDVSQGTPDDACPYGPGAVLTVPEVWYRDAGRGPGGRLHPGQDQGQSGVLDGGAC